jgi:hypothetical protein
VPIIGAIGLLLLSFLVLFARRQARDGEMGAHVDPAACCST